MKRKGAFTAPFLGAYLDIDMKIWYTVYGANIYLYNKTDRIYILLESKVRERGNHEEIC